MIEKLLQEYIFDTENVKLNYDLGIEYEKIGQTASAITFFLKAAERTQNTLLAYECLVRTANCFQRQRNRDFTVRSMYQAAIALMPDRPEAYCLLSRQLEREKNYFESYMMAEIGLNVSADKEFECLNVDYLGRWMLTFEKAVSSWWRGRGKESRQLFQNLFNDHWNEMDISHREAVQRNIVQLGSSPQSYIYRMYNKSMHRKLRHKFPGSANIRNNYSQIYQDLFVLSMLDGKRNGTFFEIGGAEPTKGNNTYLLEKEFNWKGVSVEFNAEIAQEYSKVRPHTKMYAENALMLNYESIFKNNFDSNIIDYLQLDIEPAENTYECLKRIPFDKYKFRVITYEHDYYADFTRSFREKSREYLTSKGYVLVANDLSFDGVCTFEDWWVHPELVSKDILNKMKDISTGAKDATEYMLSNEEIIYTQEFDWGLIRENSWFKDILKQEIFVNDVYQKFVAVKENDVVLDIGASVGPFAWAIKNKKTSKVVCLEPHDKLFETLKKNAKNAVCINKAIGSSDGKTVIKGLFNESMVETHEECNEKEVETITFMSLIKENNIDHVNFLKIDCEGGEYDIFSTSNFPWIYDNVDYIVGEWHLSDKNLKEKFRYFRDNYLSKFDNYEVYSSDDVNIKHDVWSDWFIERYEGITIYIDNRVKKIPQIKPYIKNKWKYSVAPTLEFTTSVPAKGCVVDCVFCPQRTLIKNYKGERRLSLENFKRVVDKLPTEIRVTFSGFVEPWLNSDCTDMVLYAHEKGHPVSVFTTLVGVSIEDIERIKHIPFAGQPNGGFTVHLPDQEKRAKHPITRKYIETVEHLSKVCHEIQNFSVMSMGQVHESVRQWFPTAHTSEMWSRAGNLIGERMLKPELKDQNFLSIDHGDKIVTCGCDERLYHNVMLPNGDVSLCCMDYGVEEITGNLFEQDYNDVIPDPYSAFDLCRKCENAIEVNSRFIKAERKMYNV